VLFTRIAGESERWNGFNHPSKRSSLGSVKFPGKPMIGTAFFGTDMGDMI
jgi:hypothetical protein